MDPDSWNTPPEVLDRVRCIGPIALDPCGNATSIVNAAVEYRLEHGEDGLAQSWLTRGLVFVNPPYSRGNLAMWADKILHEADQHAEVIALVPAKVETNYWHDVFWRAQGVCFPDHRIRHYVNGVAKGAGRFASAVCYFGHRVDAFCEAFEDLGKICRVR